MTDRELMQQALEALERYGGVDQRACDAEEALRERLAQPEQESVKFCTYPKCQTTAGCAGVCARQNTAPQRREWVGLTADEIWKCNKAKSGSTGFHICYAHQNVEDFAEAIEAKLKEKNT